MTFGQTIKAEMEQRRWNGVDLIAQVKRQTGYRLTHSMLTHVYKDRVVPGPDLIIAISRAFKIDPAPLFSLAKKSRLDQIESNIDSTYQLALKNWKAK